MTVSSSTNKIIGNGNGATTSWPFAFKVFDPDHLVVTYTDAAGAESALDPGDYTVGLNGDQDANPGGTVTYAPAIAGGTKLTILRSAPYTQAIDIKNQGGFFPEVLERGLDLVVMQVQELREQLSRALKLSASQSAIGELQASDAGRANMLVGFDAQGMLATVSGGASANVSVAMQPVVGAASLANARTAMGLGGLATLNADPAALPKAGGAMTGTLNEAKGAALVSAATTNIWSVADGNTLHVTGTTSITSFGSTALVGARRRVIFDGVLGIANNANIVTGTGRAITTQAGDAAEIVADTGSQAVITAYRRADGSPLLPHKTMVRQTVMAGPLDSAGLPNFLPATSGTLSLTAQNVSSGVPLVVAAANGFGEAGAVDRIALATANPQWTGLAASRAAATPNFLYLVVNADGTLTPGSTILAPIYQWGGTPAATNGQFTFNIAEMRGYLGNGTTAPQAYVVFVGEAATDGSGVIGTVGYAFNGRYDSGWLTNLPGSGVGGSTSILSNLGIQPRAVRLVFECVVAEGGFSVGEQCHSPQFYDGTYVRPAQITTTRNVIVLTVAGYTGQNKTSGMAIALTAANWKHSYRADRGW